MSGFLPLRVRHTRSFLKQLREDSATGPDLLPARILKECSAALALPITLLNRNILFHGIWPEGWRHHWLFALHKKHAKSNPRHCRGIHLTPQLSKISERCVGNVFLPYLEKVGAYGPNQFAYRARRGFMDVLAWNTMYWIKTISNRCRVGLYCSDVSGAFDRVRAKRLLLKLERHGVHEVILKLLSSWLSERQSTVVVDGEHSEQAALLNSVFQGTVWGPPLWNVFYEDARAPINLLGFIEMAFADDLNCFKAFDNSIPNAVIHEELVVCQNSLHTWGRANQVLCDSAKESHHILHPKRFSGDNFRLLGVTFDPQLSMKTACYEIAAIASTRLRALLRTRHFHSRASLVLQFKSQVLSGIDFATPAIYHAPRFYVGVIDRVQEEFCEAIGVSKLEALLEYNLPPLSSRRDMSGLSLIHRVVLGIAPPQFSKLLYPAHEHYLQRGWAFRISRH